MWRTFLGLVLLAGLFLSPGDAFAQKSYGADTFYVRARIEEGGSLGVQEEITFRFEGGHFTYVFRELPLTLTDGIVDITAGVDGLTWPSGTGPGQVEITGDDPLRITWHLPATTNTVQSFDLSYRMLGVVSQAPGADVLKWRPLPNQYEYQIDQSEVIIDYPSSAELLTSPGVTAGNAQVTNQPGQVTLATGALAPDTPLEVELWFTPGSLITMPPAWQLAQVEQEARQLEQNQRGLLWILGSGLLLLLGTAGAIMVTRPYRRDLAKSKGLTYSPPDTLAPAIAGLLRTSSGTPAWSHALGTFFDLARRGLISIEESKGQKWYRSQEFTIRLLKRPAAASGLWPHEQALLALLFKGDSDPSSDVVNFSKLGKLITSSRWKLFSESLKAEVKTAGLWSKPWEAARSKVTVIGFVFLGLTVLSLPLIVLIYDRSGLWPLALMAALALLSIVWIIAGTSIPVWSVSGETLANEWEPFYRYLRDVARGKVAPGQPDEFERHLPFAAAYGQLHQWAKRFEKRGWSETPAYFRTLSRSGESNMAAFVAMTAVTASSGGSAAGASAAGAAGAAGGGASGAG